MFYPIRYKSTGALVMAVRVAKAMPETIFNTPGGGQISGAEILLNFQRGLMLRCNRGLSVASDDYMADLRHDQRIVSDAQKRIRWSGRNLLRNRKMIRRYPALHNPEPIY